MERIIYICDKCKKKDLKKADVKRVYLTDEEEKPRMRHFCFKCYNKVRITMDFKDVTDFKIMGAQK